MCLVSLWYTLYTVRCIIHTIRRTSNSAPCRYVINSIILMKIYVSAKQSKTFKVLESRQINSIAPCERHLALVINIEKSTFFLVAHHAFQTIWLASENVFFFSSNVIFRENEEQEKKMNWKMSIITPDKLLWENKRIYMNCRLCRTVKIKLKFPKRSDAINLCQFVQFTPRCRTNRFSGELDTKFYIWRTEKMNHSHRIWTRK